MRTVRKYSATGQTHTHSLYPQSHRMLQLSQTFKVSGSTIKVTYKAAANATGYDVVLGTGSKKENGETRPYQYGNHKKLNLKEGTVTATFKNVPKGTWVVGMHAFNRTSEDGKESLQPMVKPEKGYC